MDDLISRRAAIKAVEDLRDCYNGFSDSYDKACIIGLLEELPKATLIDIEFPDYKGVIKELHQLNINIKALAKEINKRR